MAAKSVKKNGLPIFPQHPVNAFQPARPISGTAAINARV